MKYFRPEAVDAEMEPDTVVSYCRTVYTTKVGEEKGKGFRLIEGTLDRNKQHKTIYLTFKICKTACIINDENKNKKMFPLPSRRHSL